MKIVTWNAGRGSWRSKAPRVETLQGDVVALQEVGHPPDGACWLPGSASGQGMAVIAKEGWRLSLHRIEGEQAPEAMVVDLDGPWSFRLVNIWAHPRPTYVERTLEILDLLADDFTGRTIVVGDLNSSAALAGRAGQDHQRLVRILHQRFGLASAYHAATGEEHGKESHPTHFHLRRRDRPFHLDYVFVPIGLLPILEAVEIPDFEGAPESDHRPVAVTLLP